MPGNDTDQQSDSFCYMVRHQIDIRQQTYQECQVGRLPDKNNGKFFHKHQRLQRAQDMGARLMRLQKKCIVGD